MAETTYEVGYGKPPVAKRFQKGRSGNRKGRPKAKTPDFQATIKKLLLEKIKVTENGSPTNLTKLELISKRLVNEAANGNLKAFDKLLKLEAIFEKCPPIRKKNGKSARYLIQWNGSKVLLKTGRKPSQKAKILRRIDWLSLANRACVGRGRYDRDP